MTTTPMFATNRQHGRDLEGSGLWPPWMAHAPSATNHGTKLGTTKGVFLPTVQSILGTLLFLRLTWIVGQAGVLLTIGIISLSVCCTTLTTLSLSALATNGRVKGSGVYFLITKALGPEFGSAVGATYYLGSTIAVSMIALAGVEALKSVFNIGDPVPTAACQGLGNGTVVASPRCYTHHQIFPYDDQVLSIAAITFLSLLCYSGMSSVTKIGPVLLGVVMVSILLTFIGCAMFATVADVDTMILPYTVGENVLPNYRPDVGTHAIPTFTSLLALFFPSVTGVFTGANKATLLEDPSKSIPMGTLCAGAVCTLVYMSTTIIFGFSVSNETLLNYKHLTALIAYPSPVIVGIGIVMSCMGGALQGLAGASLLLASIANDGHIRFLRVFSTVASSPLASDRSGDGSSTSAGNSALDAVVVDRASWCQCGCQSSRCHTRYSASADETQEQSTKRSQWCKTTSNGEPTLAIFVTTLITFVFVLPGGLDAIAPVVTIIYLTTYFTVNFACFMASFFNSAEFRPSWHYYNWVTACTGMVVCITLMVLISPLFSLVAMIFEVLIFQYVRNTREGKEWGSAVFSMQLEAAIKALLLVSRNFSAERLKESYSDAVQYARASSLDSYCGDGDGLGHTQDVEDDDVWTLAEKKEHHAVLEAIAKEELQREALDSFKQSAFTNGIIFHKSMMALTGQKADWRPQILLLTKMDPLQGEVTSKGLMNFASQLKKANGLTICASLLFGDVSNKVDVLISRAAQIAIEKQMENSKLRGFAQVVLSHDHLHETAKLMLQTAGLGLLQPNTVMLKWPTQWRNGDSAGPVATYNNIQTSTRVEEQRHGTNGKEGSETHKMAFTNLLKGSLGAGKALILLKGVFPSNSRRLKGWIDVWWFDHDGDLLLLIPYLLSRHKVWRQCRIRLFTTLREDDHNDANQVEATLTQQLKDLRINAEVRVITLQATRDTSTRLSNHISKAEQTLRLGLLTRARTRSP